MLLYNQFLKIAQKCIVHFNGDDGYEVAHGIDRHRINILLKICTCRTWDLTGIPCPHAIRALLYKKINPLIQIHWWYSKEAALITYSHKLQPVRGEKIWKIEPAHAMDPPPLVKLAGRQKIGLEQKNVCINRQGVWSESRKGRVMTCSTCGESGHNARGCQKVTKGKQTKVGRKTKKRTRSLIDEDDEGVARSPPPVGLTLEEELELIAP